MSRTQMTVSLIGLDSAEGRLVQTRFEQRNASLLVEFPADETPALPVGQVIRILVSGGALKADLPVPARPTFRSLGRVSTYHFQVGLMEGAVIGNAMTRRDDVRIRPDPTSPIPLCARNSETGVECEPRLQDISATGMGILMTLAEEALFAATWQISLEFTLPDSEDSITLDGAIQYRKLEGSVVRLGIRFDLDPEHEESERASEGIRRYLDARRAELRKIVEERGEELLG